MGRSRLEPTQRETTQRETLVRLSDLSTEHGDEALAIPPDLIVGARRRVRLLGIFALAGCGLFLLLDAGPLVESGFEHLGSHLIDLGVESVGLLLALLILWAGRSRRVQDETVLSLGTVSEIVICTALSLQVAVHHTTGARLPSITWVTPIIIMYPFVVPWPVGRTILAAIVSALSAPLALLAFEAAGRFDVGWMPLLEYTARPAVAVLIALLGARVMHGLGRSVAEARRLGSYELLERLGAGGMGVVWKARHRLLARPAAIKIIRPEILRTATSEDQEAVVRRFQREAQAVASLRSPHTIELYDFGVSEQGTFFHVMELLDGLDAETLIRRFGAVPPSRAIQLLVQVCRSLEEAHAKGLIHRDIKPANVFVCRYAQELDFVKVLDFGLVKKVEPSLDGASPPEGSILGTPGYLAPEQILRDRPIDARTDLYAVGCLGCWLLTGRRVFEFETPALTLRHQAHDPPEPPSRHAAQPISAELDDLLLSCLQRDPARRPQSAAILAASLARCPVDESWTQERARSWWEANFQPSSAAAEDEATAETLRL